MLGEAFAERLIAEDGFAKHIDLLHLRPLFRGVDTEKDFPVMLGSSRGFRVTPAQLSEVRVWVSEIPDWGVPLKGLEMNEAAEIAATLLEARVPRAQYTDASLTATLDVPFDLRFSIEEQWNEKRELLLEIQSVLQMLSGRRGASKKPDYEVWKKRYKGYLLSKYGGMRPKEIARLVYPGDRGGGTRVRKDLQLTRTLLVQRARRE